MLRLLVSISALCLAIVPAYAQVKVGVISSSTGPVSSIGIQQKNTVQLLPKKIGDLAIEYIYIDDSSDPTQTAKNAQRLLIEDKIDVLIGPSGSPNAMGILSFVADAKTPMLAPVGSAAVVLPMDDKRRWVFKTTQNDNLVMDAIAAHMKKSGVKTAGYIGTNDPLGDNFGKVFKQSAQNAGISVIAEERFNRSDTSVVAQALRLKLAAPDAILVGAAGATTVLPQVTLFDQGYGGKLYQTHGAGTPDFIKLGGKRVEKTLMAASPMLVLGEIGNDVASKPVAQRYIDAYKKMYGHEPGIFGANVFDAGLLLEATIPIAAKSAKPGTPEFRAALRDALEGVRDLVGVQGVYNMTAQDHSGFDQRSIVMMMLNDGVWKLAK